DAGHPPDRPARHRPHRRGLRGLRAGGGALGDRRRDPRASDALGGPRRSRDGGRRPVDQLLMAVRTGAKASSALGADERMWILNRAGRIPFVISGQGHEGAQVGIAWAFEKGKDWIAPFYRSIATCLTFGMSARDIMTAQYATANDPSSGGRQMPGHYGSHEHNLVSVS